MHDHKTTQVVHNADLWAMLIGKVPQSAHIDKQSFSLKQILKSWLSMLLEHVRLLRTLPALEAMLLISAAF